VAVYPPLFATNCKRSDVVNNYWQEVSVTVHLEAHEAVAELLTNLGAAGYAVEGDVLLQEAKANRWGDYYPPETGAPDRVTVKAYFYQPKNQEELAEIVQAVENLAEFGLKVGKVEVTSRLIHEDDWANAWKQYYHPLTIGRIVIQPSWEPAEHVDAGAVVITLDPGMAFGTGTHPSTAMCLRMLQQIDLKQKVVWDVGTGSGLLAIAAAKLGAKEVQAVDIDPVAVEVCSQNTQLNQVKVHCQHGSLGQLSGTADVIVANIVADVIIELLPKAVAKLSEDGLFITSGIIDTRADDVKTAAEAYGMVVDEELRESDWVCLSFRKGASV